MAVFRNGLKNFCSESKNNGVKKHATPISKEQNHELYSPSNGTITSISSQDILSDNSHLPHLMERNLVVSGNNHEGSRVHINADGTDQFENCTSCASLSQLESKILVSIKAAAKRMKVFIQPRSRKVKSIHLIHDMRKTETHMQNYITSLNAVQSSRYTNKREKIFQENYDLTAKKSLMDLRCIMKKRSRHGIVKKKYQLAETSYTRSRTDCTDHVNDEPNPMIEQFSKNKGDVSFMKLFKVSWNSVGKLNATVNKFHYICFQRPYHTTNNNLINTKMLSGCTDGFKPGDDKFLLEQPICDKESSHSGNCYCSSDGDSDINRNSTRPFYLKSYDEQNQNNYSPMFHQFGTKIYCSHNISINKYNIHGNNTLRLCKNNTELCSLCNRNVSNRINKHMSDIPPNLEMKCFQGSSYERNSDNRMMQLIERPISKSWAGFTFAEKSNRHSRNNLFHQNIRMMSTSKKEHDRNKGNNVSKESEGEVLDPLSSFKVTLQANTSPSLKVKDGSIEATAHNSPVDSSPETPSDNENLHPRTNEYLKFFVITTRKIPQEGDNKRNSDNVVRPLENNYASTENIDEDNHFDLNNIEYFNHTSRAHKDGRRRFTNFDRKIFEQNRNQTDNDITRQSKCLRKQASNKIKNKESADKFLKYYRIEKNDTDKSEQNNNDKVSTEKAMKEDDAREKNITHENKTLPHAREISGTDKTVENLWKFYSAYNAKQDDQASSLATSVSETQSKQQKNANSSPRNWKSIENYYELQDSTLSKALKKSFCISGNNTRHGVSRTQSNKAYGTSKSRWLEPQSMNYENTLNDQDNEVLQEKRTRSNSSSPSNIKDVDSARDEQARDHNWTQFRNRHYDLWKQKPTATTIGLDENSDLPKFTSNPMCLDSSNKEFEKLKQCPFDSFHDHSRTNNRSSHKVTSTDYNSRSEYRVPCSDNDAESCAEKITKLIKKHSHSSTPVSGNDADFENTVSENVLNAQSLSDGTVRKDSVVEMPQSKKVKSHQEVHTKLFNNFHLGLKNRIIHFNSYDGYRIKPLKNNNNDYKENKIRSTDSERKSEVNHFKMQRPTNSKLTGEKLEPIYIKSNANSIPKSSFNNNNALLKQSNSNKRVPTKIANYAKHKTVCHKHVNIQKKDIDKVLKQLNIQIKKFVYGSKPYDATSHTTKRLKQNISLPIEESMKNNVCKSDISLYADEHIKGEFEDDEHISKTSVKENKTIKRSKVKSIYNEDHKKRNLMELELSEMHPHTVKIKRTADNSSYNMINKNTAKSLKDYQSRLYLEKHDKERDSSGESYSDFLLKLTPNQVRVMKAYRNRSRHQHFITKCQPHLQKKSKSNHSMIDRKQTNNYQTAVKQLKQEFMQPNEYQLYSRFKDVLKKSNSDSRQHKETRRNPKGVVSFGEDENALVYIINRKLGVKNDTTGTLWGMKHLSDNVYESTRAQGNSYTKGEINKLQKRSSTFSVVSKSHNTARHSYHSKDPSMYINALRKVKQLNKLQRLILSQETGKKKETKTKNHSYTTHYNESQKRKAVEPYYELRGNGLVKRNNINNLESSVNASHRKLQNRHGISKRSELATIHRASKIKSAYNINRKQSTEKVAKHNKNLKKKANATRTSYYKKYLQNYVAKERATKGHILLENKRTVQKRNKHRTDAHGILHGERSKLYKSNFINTLLSDVSEVDSEDHSYNIYGPSTGYGDSSLRNKISNSMYEIYTSHKNARPFKSYQNKEYMNRSSSSSQKSAGSSKSARVLNCIENFMTANSGGRRRKYIQ